MATTPQMYYVRNRFLLPMIGTWNRRDPLGYVDGMSLYQYCYSNVIVWNDPSGLQNITAPPMRHSPVRHRVNSNPVGTPGGGPTGQANGPQGGTPVGPPQFYPYRGPNNSGSLEPYYREDDPYYPPVWMWPTLGRGPIYNRNRPSRHPSLNEPDPNWTRHPGPTYIGAPPEPLTLTQPRMAPGNSTTGASSCNATSTSPWPEPDPDPNRSGSSGPPPVAPRRTYCEEFWPNLPKCSPEFYVTFPFSDAVTACRSINRRAGAYNPQQQYETISGCSAPPELCLHLTCRLGGPRGERVDSVGSCLCCDNANGVVTRWKPYRH
jgi:hypothetical protein